LFKPRASLPEVLGHADKVLAISEHNQAWLADRHGIVAELVRCGVELPDGAVAPDEAQAVVQDGPLRVLAVGRWVPKKGFDLLVQAIDSLQGAAQLVLISDAPEDVASPYVDLLGLLPPSELRAHYRDADVVVLPCRQAPDGDMDGVPVVLMEALAQACPVITCPVSGVPELVDDTVGWLVPSEDVDALVDALKQAQDPLERAKRGRAGPDRLQARGFTVDHQVDGLLDAWLS